MRKPENSKSAHSVTSAHEHGSGAGEKQRGSWPYWSLLTFGTFSPRTPAGKRYWFQGTCALVVTLAVGMVAGWLRKNNPDASWGTWVVLLPVVPVVYLAFSFSRYLRNLDELSRKIQLEGLALSFAGTFVVVFGYGLLQLHGFPTPNWLYIWCLMCLLHGVGTAVAARKYQ